MAKRKDAEKSAQQEQKQNNKSESAEEEEPVSFDDPEGFVDKITDEELLGDILQEIPNPVTGWDCVIVVDGVPQVEKERLEKLQGVIHKIFAKCGTIVNEHYPKNDDGVTKGYIFIEYSNPQSAIDAVIATDNHRLDKLHIFQVNLFSDFKKYEEIPEEWSPPPPQPYKEHGDLHYYLLEPDAYDQFCVICDSGEPVQIWLNTIPQPTLLEERVKWTEKYVQWSPLGTYLATIHAKGVATWGGPSFEQIRKFTHYDVQFIEFSPRENYLVTYSPTAHVRDQGRLIIWDIRRGDIMRSFDPEGPAIWPVFKWSKDDKYFAKIGTDILSIYETPSFGLLDKKSVKLPGIKDFAWSPTDNILAYWVSEDENVPARLVLMEVPSRNEVRANKLFNVCDCKIHWQKSGDYLCVKVDRYLKMKKEKGEVKYINMYCNFEIFHLREKNIPVDSVEIKETIHAFAWEPVGSTFAIIHGDTNNISVSFYGLKTGHKPVLLKKCDKKSCNTLFWSPAGQFIVLADLRNNGSLEFIDTSDFTVMNTSDHYRVSDVEWDPTGRYVVTATSKWKSKDDLGYWIWTFQGRILSRNNMQKFWQLQWRPRPPTLLSSEQQKEIKKNLKKYSAAFESKDKVRMTRASKDLIEKRAAAMKKFEDYRQSVQKIWEAQKEKRLKLRNNVDTDDLNADLQNAEEEVIEFLVKQEIITLE
ncbi:eukaryotic translation initiation factor 3 subunit B [Cimex lectularius]|uniref:Eukaryotic translation initiation factor 3 subunit B n=1 Tax=Cimex lectularius TaxID=79782 RepID=A0A8I6RSC8_CIMLE|nr:eukaryotic translation initiation factor 3 subunit B [Cimex lectularius]